MCRAVIAALSTAHCSFMTCEGVFEMMKLFSVTAGSANRSSMCLIVSKNWILGSVKPRFLMPFGSTKEMYWRSPASSQTMKSGWKLPASKKPTPRPLLRLRSR